MYHTKLLESLSHGKECLTQDRIGIYDGSDLIGEYNSNSCFAQKTFFPFKVEDSWFALYCEDARATYVMSLPDCKKIAGEEPKSSGFCPVEYLVPRYQIWVNKPLTTEEMIKNNIPESNWKYRRIGSTERIFINELNPIGWGFEDNLYSCDGEVYYDLTLGLVAGYVVGDDSSYKIERLNLTKITTGNIFREASFGYFDMARGLTLKQAFRTTSGRHIELMGITRFGFDWQADKWIRQPI